MRIQGTRNNHHWTWSLRWHAVTRAYHFMMFINGLRAFLSSAVASFRHIHGQTLTGLATVGETGKRASISSIAPSDLSKTTQWLHAGKLRIVMAPQCGMKKKAKSLSCACKLTKFKCESVSKWQFSLLLLRRL